MGFQKVMDVADEVAWLTPAGWGARFPSDLNIVGFTRPLLDWHVRRRLGYDPRVRVLEETETLRLLPAARGGGGVCGILGRTRRPGSIEEALRADLVVDATGRGSRVLAHSLGLKPRRVTSALPAPNCESVRA
jgi:hypothetical protein